LPTGISSSQARLISKNANHRKRHRICSATGCSLSVWKPENSWTFAHANGKDKETLTFRPYLAMNDFAGLAVALLAGGASETCPRRAAGAASEGRLVEVMPKWRFRAFDLSVVILAIVTSPVLCESSRTCPRKWRHACS